MTVYVTEGETAGAAQSKLDTKAILSCSEADLGFY